MIYLYPTDTVYGLGVDARDGDAIARLRALKGSEGEKHYSVAVSDLDMMRQYAEVTPLGVRLAEKFLPGKLTLVLKAKDLPHVMADDGSVGVRIPDHPVVHELIQKIGGPITATSANISGMPAPSTVSEILAQLGDHAAGITYDSAWPQSLSPSLPSTVVDARGTEPVVIRAGAISELAIKNAVV